MRRLDTRTLCERSLSSCVAEAWVRASRLIQAAPGARGTRLHRKLDDPRVLLAIASWDSKAHRDAMEASNVFDIYGSPEQGGDERRQKDTFATIVNFLLDARP